ncbi:MAG: hypothetical protein ACYTGQ_10845 [Planctomycetota bacterium]|jgi:5-methylcytosine-specific restriction endonuclease McrA
MAKQSHGICGLCEREGDRTFHHLIPRTCHSNKWFRKNFTREQMNGGVDLCRDCHAAIHRFIPSEKEMGRSYNTVETLLEHEDVRNFIEWIAKRDTNRVRTRRASGEGNGNGHRRR